MKKSDHFLSGRLGQVMKKSDHFLSGRLGQVTIAIMILHLRRHRV